MVEGPHPLSYLEEEGGGEEEEEEEGKISKSNYDIKIRTVKGWWENITTTSTTTTITTTTTTTTTTTITTLTFPYFSLLVLIRVKNPSTQKIIILREIIEP